MLAAERAGREFRSQPHEKGIIVRQDNVRRSNERFPGSVRLKRKRDFSFVQNKGRRLNSRHLVVLVVRNRSNTGPRLGITISNKVEKIAPRRNTFKRRIREIFRKHLKIIRDPWDILVIARKNALEASHSELKEELLGLLERERIISRTTDAPGN